MIRVTLIALVLPCALAQEPARAAATGLPGVWGAFRWTNQPGSVRAQDPPTVEELQNELRALEQRHSEELDDLRFDLQSLQAELAATQAAARAPAQQRLNVFNPGITVFGNFLARADDRRVFADGERVDDTLLLREVEVDFRAPIDPWANGVLIAAFEQEAPGEIEASIEEGYVTLKKLPFRDASPPAGLKLQAGRFRPSFGRMNVVHLHDLPQTSYPRSLETFLGEEGFVQDGVSGQFFLPSPAESQVIEGTLALLTGGGPPAGGDLDGSDTSALGRVKWFGELGTSETLEVGTSAWLGDADHRVFGVDATYAWKPLAAGSWRSWILGGELFLSDLDDDALDGNPMGGYLWSQYQLEQNLYVGARLDWEEELADEDDSTTNLGIFATYYTTEFLRFRVGLEHTESDLDALDGRDTLLFELNFVFGSHPVEPYWVNR